MPIILVVEDEDSIRNNILRLLKIEGYDAVAAPNGKRALELAQSLHPDLILSDVNMPEMDGFAMVEALRAQPEFATTPVVFLTALDDRKHFRRGMALGADDYLTKPFTRDELLEVVATRVKRRAEVVAEVTAEVAAQLRSTAEEEMRTYYEQSMTRNADLRNSGALARTDGGFEARDLQTALGPSASATAHLPADEIRDATVLFSDIRGFTSMADKLSAVEVAELLGEYFARVTQPVLTHGGANLKFMGDGLMAVFSVSGTTNPLPHARRALMAALGMVLAAHEFSGWLQKRFGARGLGAFAIGIGVHGGEVMFCRMGTLQSTEIAAIGDTVNIASRLESKSKDLGWSIVASQLTCTAGGSGVETGRAATLVVRGKPAPIEVVEITGLKTDRMDALHAAASLTERADAIRAAIQANSEITARAVKDALRGTLTMLRDLGGASAEILSTQVRHFKGYRLLKKVGAGGMSEVFLALREHDQREVVLKVLQANPDKNLISEPGAMLARFIQEYTLLSQIDHPNVVKIYDQGFTDDNAYIAMEYFGGGDVRSQMLASWPKTGVERRTLALSVVAQAAQAIAAIHALGIIHRDLKPENLMVRLDGSLGLADFGIAKGTMAPGQMAQTRHGEIVGTPYYLSPEQAAGRPVNAASDIYSLGVIFYELLVGERPYIGDTLAQVLALHIVGPVPTLPPPYTELQPILNQMMAKEPAARYQSAEEVLVAITDYEVAANS